MIEDHLRHWVLINLHRFREWATDHRIQDAKLIDNQDGTYGRAFDLRMVPPEMIVMISPTMELALKSGMNAIEPLSTASPRLIQHPPDLQKLLAQYGGYNLITPQAWEKWDREQEEWRQRHRQDQNVISK